MAPNLIMQPGASGAVCGFDNQFLHGRKTPYYTCKIPNALLYEFLALLFHGQLRFGRDGELIFVTAVK